MPSANLLFQALASGLFMGALYGLIGLGLGLGWGILKQINLAHFAWVFLSAYLTYELKTQMGLDPLLCLLILIPVFTLLGVGLQALLAKFSITPFNSLMATFGLTVSVEALIQLIWSADFRRMNSHYDELKFRVFGIIVTYSEAITMVLSVLCCLGVWWVLYKTDMGKALRASAEDPDIARAFGINASKLSLGLLCWGLRGFDLHPCAVSDFCMDRGDFCCGDDGQIGLSLGAFGCRLGHWDQRIHDHGVDCAYLGATCLLYAFNPHLAHEALT
jgi:branched-chain amino acid transport system permease protein